MKKKIFYITAAVLFLQASLLTAQDNSSVEDNIQLPTVTTVVTGDSLTAEDNAVPDFEIILPAYNTEASLILDVPEPSSVNEKEVSEENNADAQTKSVFAEGIVGAGYKGFYKGDFSIYKTGTDNPYKINFATENKDGNHMFNAANGFFERSAKLSALSTINAGNNFTNEALLNYSSSTEGFQSLIPDFYDNNKSFIYGFDSLSWAFSKKWFLNFTADASYYERFAGLTGISSGLFLPQEKKADVYRFSPLFSIGYGNADENGFRFCMNTSFTESAFSSDASWSSVEIPYSRNLVTKFKVGADFGYKNNFLNVTADGFYLLNNNHFMNDILRQHMPSFNVAAELKLLSSLSTRIMNVALKGGLKSELPEFSELESKYKYALLNCIPGETSDWYVDFNVCVPVGNVFTVDANASWFMTAFGNGLWEPDYSDASKGFFGYRQNDRMEINSALKLSYVYKTISIGLGWNAYWNYVPVLEAPQNICLNIDIQSEKGKWGAGLCVKEALGGKISQIPVIDFSAFMMAGKSARITFKLEDAVIFFTPDGSRNYAGTNYITNQDRFSVLLKFFF